MNALRIATRRSDLAMWQAESVAAALRVAHPGLEVSLVPMTTTGDERLDTSLAKVGGKALFTKELERAMEDGLADLAVHSMKDVPVELPAGMTIGAILERGDPGDAFVSAQHATLSALAAGARVGTSSLRRECQVRRAVPGIAILPLRGNVGTRLAKLDAGAYDAIILAVAGLERLGLAGRIRERIPARTCLPAIGQGAIGVEHRAEDARVAELVSVLNHGPTRLCVEAERAVNMVLHGGCHAPLAAYAVLEAGVLNIVARVGMPDGSLMLEATATGDPSDAVAIGQVAGMDLMSQGAGDILSKVLPV